MITPAFSPTATERVLPRLALDFTTASLDARVTVTRALNTATRTNSSGFLEIVNANTPRFDYEPTTLLCKGLLIEETRANLLLNSLIDGTNLSTQSVTLSATAYTLSFYGTGSIAISGGHSATVTGSGSYPARKTYTFTPSAGSSTFTVSGTVQYAQLEAGAFATSYIPTTTTSLTRNLDSVTMTGTNFSDWFNPSEGTFVVGLQKISPSSQAIYGFDVVGAASTYSMRVRLGTDARMQSVDNSVVQVDAQLAGSVPTTPAKYAMAYKLNDYAGAADGAAVVTDTSATVPALSSLNIGSTIVRNLYARTLYYYPQRLTNAEVQAFSK